MPTSSIPTGQSYNDLLRSHITNIFAINDHQHWLLVNPRASALHSWHLLPFLGDQTFRSFLFSSGLVLGDSTRRRSSFQVQTRDCQNSLNQELRFSCLLRRQTKPNYKHNSSSSLLPCFYSFQVNPYQVLLQTQSAITRSAEIDFFVRQSFVSFTTAKIRSFWGVPNILHPRR